MSYIELLKTERFPTTWCAGCGNGIIMINLAKVMEELKMDYKNTVVVSGIGCSGRTAGYFNMDSVHGLHGRAIPLAEGIKLANNKLNVVVVSGDGDLTGIGGNHLLHASRRDTDITVVCATNEIYGMTGGQMSPTTRLGATTMTSPYGNKTMPINLQGLITQNKRYFYARTTVFHINHLKKCIKEAIQWKGFSFVDIISDCPTNFGRRVGYKNAYQMLMDYKKNYQINDNTKILKDSELGVIRSEGNE